MIRKHKNYKKGMPVKLMICYSAAGGEDSLAYALAKELGVPVTGSTGPYLYHPIIFPWHGPAKEMKTFKP